MNIRSRHMNPLLANLQRNIDEKLIMDYKTPVCMTLSNEIAITKIMSICVCKNTKTPALYVIYHISSDSFQSRYPYYIMN